MEFINPNSLEVIRGYAEPSLEGAAPGDHFQFQRLGYFVVDSDSTAGHKVFNRTVPLGIRGQKFLKSKKLKALNLRAF